MFGWLRKKKPSKPRNYVSSTIDLTISTGSITAAREKKILAALEAISEMSKSINGMIGIRDERDFSVINTYQTRGEDQYGRLTPTESPENLEVDFGISVELIDDQTSSGSTTLDILWSGYLSVVKVDPETGDEEVILEDEPDEMTTSKAQKFFTSSLMRLEKLGVHFSNGPAKNHASMGKPTDASQMS